MSTSGVYLDAYLAPLAQWLSRPDVTDLLINRPGEVWIESTGGAMSREPADQLTEVALQRLARQIAAASHQGVNREQPLLSATLPDGARVQVAAPPATRGGLIMAVRKHVLSDMSLEDMGRDGLFERRPSQRSRRRRRGGCGPGGPARRQNGRSTIGLPSARRWRGARPSSSPAAPAAARPPCSTPS